MHWLIDQIFTLVGLGLFLLLVAAVLAPLESLGWWAGWSGKPKRLKDIIEGEKATSADQPAAPEAERYLVYLSDRGGICRRTGA